MARRATGLTHFIVCLVALLAAGCLGGKRDVYRPPATARESCEQVVLGRSFGRRPPVDVFNREVDRCLNEYRGIFHAGDPDLTARASRCIRRTGTADVDIIVNAVNTNAGRNLEFGVEVRNVQIVQSGTGTSIGTFPTLRYRVPAGTPFSQDSPVALPVGT